MLLVMSLFLLLLWTASADAVVPQLWSVMQGFLSFLPQIVLFIFFSISLIFKWSTWKALYTKWRSRPIFVHLTIVLFVGLAAYIYFGMLRASPSPSASVASLTDWPALGKTAQRNAYSGQEPVHGIERWHFRETLDRAPFNSSPAIAGNRVFVGGDNSTLYCFDATTGDVVWKYETMYEVFSSPAVADGRVYFGEGLHYVDDALFYCVDATTGDLVWKFQTTSHTESSPTIVDGWVFFGAGDDGVYCLSAATGDIRWQYTGVHTDSAPLVVGERIYFGSGYGSEGLYCASRDTGNPIWNIPLEVPAWGGPSAHNGHVYVGVGNGNFSISDPIDPRGGVLCLDAEMGGELWRFDAQDAVLTSVALDGSRAYFGSRDGFFYCIDATTGKEIWHYDAATPILSSPAIGNSIAYFGANDGLVRALNTTDGSEAWQFDVGKSALNTDARILASPAVSSGQLYVGSMNFFFYCLE